MKILAAVFDVKTGRPGKNAAEMIKIMRENDADIYLFPAYCLTGASAGKLVNYQSFADQTNEALDTLLEYSENENKIFVTAVAGYENIIVRDGELLQKAATTVDGKRIVVAQPGDDGNADVILLPTAMAGYPCIQNDIIEFCSEASSSKNCAIAVANAGFGESSADNVYKGFAGVFNKGIICAFKSQDEPETAVACYDVDAGGGLVYTRPNRGIDRIPYYGKNEPHRYLDELFKLQTQALYTRLHGCGIKKIVLGVSGGADSTLALLCAEKAIKMLKLPMKNIIAVTMPGFGTGTRTRANADALTNTLGVTTITVDIKKAVSGHLSDIGHDETLQDVTYENAQARERTQILFDIANMHNALVLGTGDMSEAALGFCTFGGDTVSHYNPNATIPKTLVLELIKHIAETKDEKTAGILTDIANTPISPELKKGQETEKIIGRYDLHDFFLFFFAKLHKSYDEIKNLALAVFEDTDESEIVTCLDVFYDRYKKNRFKRSTVFEGANLIGFSLPYIAADIDYDLKI